MTGQQLKNSILQWAIQGKLVPQIESEGTAEDLLKEIRAEKEKLVKEGKLKKKDLEVKPIEDDEIPFEIPESWRFVRLGNVINIKSGDGLTSKDMIKGDIPVYGGNGITGYHNKSNVECETVVIGRVGFYCGSVHVTGKKAWVTDNAFITTYPIDYINREYLVYCLRTMNLGNSFNATAQPVVSGKKIYPMLFPLPPLSEQKRIVAKIEELMPLVEEYGKAQERLETLNRELPEKLKKSVLQEAIMGKLVPQDPKEGTAEELLAEIRKEKEKLVKEGNLKKKDLEIKPIAEDEIPFEIPEGWRWCRLGDLGVFERGSGIKRDETFESGYPCVRYGEMYTIYRYSTTFSETRSYTTKNVFDKCRKAHNGDIFMALTGENKEEIALASLYVGKEEIAVGGDLCHFTPFKMDASYLVYFINSPFAIKSKRDLATGDIIVHISTDKLSNILFPLPPIAEQKRIVAKLEEVMKEIEGMK